MLPGDTYRLLFNSLHKTHHYPFTATYLKNRLVLKPNKYCTYNYRSNFNL